MGCLPPVRKLRLTTAATFRLLDADAHMTFLEIRPGASEIKVLVGLDPCDTNIVVVKY
jgi:hypothetical protein